MTFPTPNSDEIKEFGNPGSGAAFLGNFHKTLPHDQFGEVDRDAYRDFVRTCQDIAAGMRTSFERVRKGLLVPAFASTADAGAASAVAKFTSPLAGAATEEWGPDPTGLEMPPAPGINSLSSAAEMVELYWMALLRDKPLHDFATDPDVASAVAEVGSAFQTALDQDRARGRLKLGQDLPANASGLDLRQETLFRCGLHDEALGPLVSQFFLRDTPYGVQTISAKQTPYVREKDFLTSRDDWLRAQNTGKDRWGRDYGSCNNYADQIDPARAEIYYANSPRFISTLRDLARFVNRDALHQAYFNAALFLDAINAPLDDGNPYKGVRKSREGAFATLGGPDLLTVVSEVASRALKVVWRQKWLVHRRARPEVYGGMIEMQEVGVDTNKRFYGLQRLAIDSVAAQRVRLQHGTNFLPMAFSAGSPAHPAYGAGHATVAGACVTVLKAWFDEDARLEPLLAQAASASRRKEPVVIEGLLQPGAHLGGENFADPAAYTGADAGLITVGGELNKLAANVAMGRSMGGVHWRSDNTRSLRLGERVAMEILRRRSLEYAERPLSFTFRSFDGVFITISEGQIDPLPT
jgi:hypothetical protein